MKKIITLISLILSVSMLGFTSCSEDEMDDSIPVNPVMVPIKSVTAEDGDEIATAVISDMDRTIELSLKNLKSLKNVNVTLHVSKRAQLITPADTILTLDLSQPYTIIINDIFRDLTYTLTATIPETVLVDNSNFKELRMNNDSPKVEGDIAFLWDGKKMSKPEAYGEVNYGNYYTGFTDSQEPACFTFDMGEAIYLYRFRASLYWAYTNICPKQYELWGYLGEGEPAKDGNWDNWTKLSDIDNSSSTLADFGEGDNVYIEKENSPKVRYMRVRCLQNYRGTNGFSLCEITVWAYNM